MYFIDFDRAKSIYEILGVPRDVPLKQLQQAYRDHTRPLEKAVRRDGDRIAEQKLKELSGLKDKIWKAEPRAEYDAALGDAPSFEFGDPVPSHFTSRTALLRSLREQLRRDEGPTRYAAMLAQPQRASRGTR